MPRDIESIAFEGSQERAAFEALVRDRPEMWGWFHMGEQGATTYAVPRIQKGILGSTEKAIDKAVESFVQVALKELRRGPVQDQADEDECFAYRIGFKTVAAPARDAKLRRRPLTPADFGCLPLPSRS